MPEETRVDCQAVLEQKTQEFAACVHLRDGNLHDRFFVEGEINSLWSNADIEGLFPGLESGQQDVIRVNYVLVLSILVYIGWIPDGELFTAEFLCNSRLSDHELPFGPDVSLRFLGLHEKEFREKQMLFKPCRVGPGPELNVAVYPANRPWPFLATEQVVSGPTSTMWKAEVASSYHPISPSQSSSKPEAVVYKTFRNREAYQNELVSLEYLRNNGSVHPHVCLHIAAFVREPDFYIFFPYTPYGDLEVLLNGGEDSRNSTPTHHIQKYDFEETFGAPLRSEFVQQLTNVASAIDYLHRKLDVVSLGESFYCAHLDLEPRNILIFPDTRRKLSQVGGVGNWMISNFSVSLVEPHVKRFDVDGRPINFKPSTFKIVKNVEDQFSQTLTSTELSSYRPQALQHRKGAHVAPELHELSDAPLYQIWKCDIWSFGCIAAEVFSFITAHAGPLSAKAAGQELKNYRRRRWSKAADQSFFEHQRLDDTYLANLKPSVKDYLDEIKAAHWRDRREESSWVNEFAELVRNILSIQPADRPEARNIVEKLGLVRTKLISSELTKQTMPPRHEPAHEVISNQLVVDSSVTMANQDELRKMHKRFDEYSIGFSPSPTQSKTNHLDTERTKSMRRNSELSVDTHSAASLGSGESSRGPSRSRSGRSNSEYTVQAYSSSSRVQGHAQKYRSHQRAGSVLANTTFSNVPSPVLSGGSPGSGLHSPGFASPFFYSSDASRNENALFASPQMRPYVSPKSSPRLDEHGEASFLESTSSSVRMSSPSSSAENRSQLSPPNRSRSGTESTRSSISRLPEFARDKAPEPMIKSLPLDEDVNKKSLTALSPSGDTAAWLNTGSGRRQDACILVYVLGALEKDTRPFQLPLQAFDGDPWWNGRGTKLSISKAYVSVTGVQANGIATGAFYEIFSEKPLAYPGNLPEDLKLIVPSSSGMFALVCGRSNKIQLWNSKNPGSKKEINGGSLQIVQCSFNSDGTRLFVWFRGAIGHDVDQTVPFSIYAYDLSDNPDPSQKLRSHKFTRPMVTDELRWLSPFQSRPACIYTQGIKHYFLTFVDGEARPATVESCISESLPGIKGLHAQIACGTDWFASVRSQSSWRGTRYALYETAFTTTATGEISIVRDRQVMELASCNCTIAVASSDRLQTITVIMPGGKVTRVLLRWS